MMCSSVRVQKKELRWGTSTAKGLLSVSTTFPKSPSADEKQSEPSDASLQKEVKQEVKAKVKEVKQKRRKSGQGRKKSDAQVEDDDLYTKLLNGEHVVRNARQQGILTEMQKGRSL